MREDRLGTAEQKCLGVSASLFLSYSLSAAASAVCISVTLFCFTADHYAHAATCALWLSHAASDNVRNGADECVFGQNDLTVACTESDARRCRPPRARSCAGQEQRPALRPQKVGHACNTRRCVRSRNQTEIATAVTTSPITRRLPNGCPRPMPGFVSLFQLDAGRSLRSGCPITTRLGFDAMPGHASFRGSS